MSDHFDDETTEVSEAFMEPIEGTFIDLGRASREPPEWLIENLLPVGLTVVGGPPKSGKSGLEMAMAALVAGLDCKALPPDLSKVHNSGPVMGFSIEASAGELRYMVEEGMGTHVPDNESILIAEDPFAWQLDDADGQERLERWLKERQPRLVFLDPLRDLHSGDENDSGEMIRVLRPLQQWAKKQKTGVLVVHHTSKPKEGQREYDPLSLRGSGAIFGLADAVLMMTPTANDFFKLKAIFKRAQSWERVVRMAMWQYRDQPTSDALDPFDQSVYQGIVSGVGTLKDIADQLHVGKVKVVEAAKRLFDAGLIRKEGGQWVMTDTR